MATKTVSLPKSRKDELDDPVSSRGQGPTGASLGDFVRKDGDRQRLRALLLEGAESPHGAYSEPSYFDLLRQKARCANR